MAKFAFLSLFYYDIYMKQITSKDNPSLKLAQKLMNSRERKQSGLILIEGSREITLAIEQKLEIVTLFLCPDLLKNSLDWQESASDILILPESLFNKISYKDKPEGILAIAKAKNLGLEQIKLSTQPLVIILENIEKPGNLGAIFRTAFAAKVDAIIINDPQTDIYNPNVIRSSMGHLFTNQVAIASQQDTAAWLQNNNITTYATAITAKANYNEVDWQKGSAIVLGTENSGLSTTWLRTANEQIIIPMQAGIDSLNVSVSSAIIIYEALRQRHYPNQ